MKKIAIIGTGIMGAGMATNYLKNGYEVHVWNRGKERLGPLVELGAIEAASPKAAAQSVDIVFDVTANDEASRSVWLAEDGILAGAHAGSQLIASGTFSIPWTDELARECAKRGHIHFDIPLTGSRMGAEGGTMILLAGGDKKQFAALEPGLGEALRIAKASGMDVEAVGAALAERPGGVITNLAWNAYQNPPKQTNFSVKWIDKDLHYAKDFSGELPVPLLEGVLKHFDAALERGLGEDDWTASNT